MEDIALLRFLDSCHKDDVEEAHSIIQEGLERPKSRWIVNTLVDYYFHYRSTEALSIIKSLPGVQADALFDKLNNSLQKKETCLYCLKLVLYLVTAQLSWLYRIIEASFFNNLLKLLKTNKDILILTFAIYCVTSTMSLSPVAVVPHMPDLCEIFSRLIIWRETEGHYLPPTAHVLFKHLDVGVYHFFLQLYAMFPCSFLQYLKARYGPKGEADIFTKKIQPLFSFAQIHPKLISCNSDKEKDKRIWSHLEAHDVALMGCDIALDPVMSPAQDITSLLQDTSEGATKEDPTERTSSLTKLPVGPENSQGGDVGEYPNLGSIEEEVEQLSHGTGYSNRSVFWEGSQEGSQVGLTEELKSVSQTSLSGEKTCSVTTGQDGPLTNKTSNLVSSKELESLWSPLEVLGMQDVTDGNDGPLSNQSSVASMPSSHTGSGLTSSQISMVSSPAVDVAGRSNYPWTHMVQQQSMTVGTYSPTASTHSAYIEDEIGVAEQRNSKTNSVIRFPSSIPGDLSNDRLAHSLPSSHSHSESSGTNSAFSSPTRSYRGVNSPKPSKKDPGVLSATWNKIKRVLKGTPEYVTSNSIIEEHGEGLFQDFEDITVVNGKPVFTPLASDGGKGVSNPPTDAKDGNRTPRVEVDSPRIPKKIPSTEDCETDGNTGLNETVSATVDDSNPCNSESEEVSTAERKLSSSYPFSPNVSIPPRSHNSLSLPSGAEEDAQVDPTQQRLRALFRTRRHSFVVDIPSRMEMSASCPSSTVGTPQRVPSHGKLCDLSTPLVSRFSLGDVTDASKDPKFEKSEQPSEGTHNVLSRRTHSTCSTSTLIPQSPIVTQESRENRPQLAPKHVVHPYVQNVSPIAVLDDYIKMGTAIHHYETDEMPLPDHEVTDWSHFGNCIHQEELAVAQCQVGLLQCQLLFERYKCQQHIQRNRRLRSTASRAGALSEEVTALEHTNLLLKNTLRAKEIEFAVMKENCRRESDARHQLESRAKKEIQSYHQRTGQLLEENSRLKEDLKTLSNRNQCLLRELEDLEGKVFCMDNRHAYLQQQILLAKGLVDQSAVLKRERLVLGEWKQQQLEWINLAKHQNSIDGRSTATPTDKAASEGEVGKLENEVTFLKAQVSELKAELNAKENVIVNCRRQLEEELIKHKREVKELKDRLLAESRAHSQANSKVLELKTQQHAEGLREKGKTAKPSHLRWSYQHRRTASQPTSNLLFGDQRADVTDSLRTNTSIMES